MNWLGGIIRVENKLFLFVGNVKIVFIDVCDIVDVVVICLLEEGYYG